MKTGSTIRLKSGYLTFLKDRIEISDNSKIEQILILIVFFTTSIYGLVCVVTYTNTEGPMMYYSGIIILLTWALSSPLLIRRTFKHVLYYNEIGKINMKENFGGGFSARFKLKRGQIRFVYLNSNRNDIEIFLNKLSEFQLESDIKFQIV